MPKHIKIKFLTNWKIDLSKVPAYIDFNQDFKEQVDYELSKLILNYDGDDRLTDEVKIEFKKLFDRINPETSMLSVHYSPRYKIGRRYPDCPDQFFPNGIPNPNYNKHYSGLISQPRIIKNTIFHYQDWVDIDQKKGHPTLLLSIAEANGVDLPAYKTYLLDGNFDNIVREFSDWYNVDPELSVDQLKLMSDEEQKEYFKTRIDKKDIKWLFNKTIYGGGHKKWIEDIKNGSWSKDGKKICRRCPKDIKNQNNPHPFYTAFKKDTRKVIDRVYIDNDALAEIVCKDIQGGDDMDWKRKNRVMSYFCGIIENEITFRAYKYLINKNLVEKGFCSWALDGITIPAPSSFEKIDVHFNEMNEYVRNQTGLSRITFVRKVFDNDELLMPLINARKNLTIAIPVSINTLPVVGGVPIIDTGVIDCVKEDDGSNTNVTSVVLEAIIEDDNEGANLIFDLIQDRFKFCNGNIFFKQTHVWVNSKQIVDNHLLNYILTKTNLTKLSGGKNPVPKPYSTNVGSAKSLREALYARLLVDGQDNTLLNKFITTTKGRLCFLDGVLDLTYTYPDDPDKKGRFYTWDEVDFEYYTPVQIERGFCEYFKNPIQSDIDDVKSKIFENLFGTADCNKALAFFARGVAGHFEDKAWSLYIGNRNCGKGVVADLTKKSLGSYFGSVDSQNFLCNSNRTLKQEQPEKQMAFALDFQFARLTFSQELPAPTKNKTIKINAEIIKKLMSGGDPLRGKRNYDVFITDFINQSRLIIMANDCPTFTNEDVLQTCSEFNSTQSFKTKEEINKLVEDGEHPLVLCQYREADPLIKTQCQTDDWANAFIMLMVNHYQNYAVPCVDKNSMSSGVDAEDCKSNLRKFIITAFEITNKSGDFLKNEEIQGVFEENTYGDISTKKIGIELKAIGMIPDKQKGARGWCGLKLKNIPVDGQV
jgi:hypothetical protein